LGFPDVRHDDVSCGLNELHTITVGQCLASLAHVTQHNRVWLSVDVQVVKSTYGPVSDSAARDDRCGRTTHIASRLRSVGAMGWALSVASIFGPYCELMLRPGTLG